MTELEYLLCAIGEESVEVSQRSSKAQRFGLHEVQDGVPLDNAERLIYEFNDLYALLLLLQKDHPEIGDLIVPEHIMAKQQKYQKYLDYAKRIGTVTT